MDNITYIIKENKSNNNETNNANNNNDNSNNDNVILLEKTNDYINHIENEKYAQTLDYELNYNIKYLTILLELYGIKKSKMNKSIIINTLVEFEVNINNTTIVNNSKRLYENLIELKNNSYLSKFILI